jgi:hypothetical protein
MDVCIHRYGSLKISLNRFFSGQKKIKREVALWRIIIIIDIGNKSGLFFYAIPMVVFVSASDSMYVLCSDRARILASCSTGVC